MEKRLVQISKFLSLVLRHQPEVIGVELDENGWVDVDELLEKVNASGRQVDRKLLTEVVEKNDKKRFKFSGDRQRIRASQGHSIEVNLKLEPQAPPIVLFHGTAKRNLESILRSGLRRQKRQHVHLSIDRITAHKVGSRHGSPVVLRIDSQKMHEDGHVFYLSDNHVWLTDEVPPQYISY